MRKSIIAIATAISVLIPFTVNAQEVTGSTDPSSVTTPISASVPLNANVPENPEYTITLPTGIEIDGNLEASYDVTVKGNTERNMIVTVKPDSVVTMTNDSKSKSETIETYQAKTKWYYADITAEGGKTATGSIKADRLTAGEWKGNLTFSISVEYAAYIADDGSIAYTWDTLLSQDYVRDLAAGSYFSNLPAGKLYVPETANATVFCSNSFKNCTNLTGIVDLKGLTIVGSDAFIDCTNLKTVTLSESCKTLSYNCFQNCTSLESITIPSSVKTIQHDAFSGCEKLQSVKVPDSVETIGSNAFKGVGTVYYSGQASGAPWGANKVLPYKDAP